VNILIFDSHAHYDHSDFDNDRDELLQKFTESAIEIINVGTDIESSLKSIKLSEKYKYIHASIGVHPNSIYNLEKNYLKILKELIINDKVVAIGEIGLDYSNSKDKEIQTKVFIDQILLAKEVGLPVIIHCREAYHDMLEILKKYRPIGLLHCFSGDKEFAKEILSLNLKIGIGGILTFKNSFALGEVVKNVPMENILLETDAPYLAPVPFRGKRCDSSHIEYTVKKISDIKNIKESLIFDIVKNNSYELFRLDIEHSKY